jgi:hypothetical protein
MVSNRALVDFTRLLAPEGIYAAVSLGSTGGAMLTRVLSMAWRGFRAGSQQFRFVSAAPSPALLEELRARLEDGSLQACA